MTIIIKSIIYDVNNFKNFVFNKFINISHDDEMLTKKNEIFSKTCDIEPDTTLKWVALRETSLSRKWFDAITFLVYSGIAVASVFLRLGAAGVEST